MSLLLLLPSLLPGGCILMAACSRPPASNAAHYAAALAEPGGYPLAAARCAPITDAALQGDCLVALMERWNVLTADACDSVTDTLWRDECLFTLSERLWASGQHEAGLGLCLQTRFARQCGYHLLQREVEAAAAIGDPLAAEARLIPFARTHTRVPDAPLLFWSLWFRRRARLEHPIDEHDCDGLQRTRPCELGLERYLHEVLSAQQKAHGEPCASSLPPDWQEGPRLRAAITRWQTQRCPASRQTPAPP